MIGQDPFNGHLFLFRGKRGDYFKAIYRDGSGLWLLAKRLEKGRFVWPPIVDGAMTLSPAQLAVLIEAMDYYSVSMNRIVSRDVADLVGPSMDDRLAVDVLKVCQDRGFKFGF